MQSPGVRTFRVGLAAVCAVALLAGCSSNRSPATEPEAQSAVGKQDPELVSGRQALQQADIADTHPDPMEHAEAARVLERNPECLFALTASGKPVVVARAPADQAAVAQAVAKINGQLVGLRSAQAGGFQALANGARLVADGLELVITPTIEEEEEYQGRRQWPADLEIRLEQGLTRGYRGLYRCDA